MTAGETQSSTDTVRHLAEITDAATFERIAAAVLRAADPSIYANMAHPGVQPGGKTIKAPFDNVGWIRSEGGSCRFVCAAHTTEQNDLSGKWLHDPATVKVKMPGRKPTKPAGDLVKGIEEIEKLREGSPELAVTFALTTNIETSLALRYAAERMAEAAKIDLDIWSVSRIAHFLDTNSAGQVIRRLYLGTSVTLLSRDILLKMGQQSIYDHGFEYVTWGSIHRDDFRMGYGDSLVVGDSGMGKTTTCVQALLAYIANGIPAIVIRTEFLDSASTIAVALESELKRQEPGLEAGCGEKALELCSADEPLLILFEDINRSTNPGRLLNKILSWGQLSRTEDGIGRHWSIVCPVWPRLMDLVEGKERRLADVEIIRIDKFSEVEAVRAVMRRAEILGLPFDEGRAISVASQLGYDPLLIGLHDLRKEGPTGDVIRSYINERIGVIAAEAQCTKAEMYEALYQMLRKGLEHRQIFPGWSEVRSWIGDKDAIALLRHLARDGSIIRLTESDAGEVIKFRHDRVMQSLLSDSITDVLKSSAWPSYIADPFFAEVVGEAIVQAMLPLSKLLSLMDSSPTVAAYALKISSENRSGYVEIATQALENWLCKQETANLSMGKRRYAIARVLGEISSEHVPQLVARFPGTDGSKCISLLAARFRNGDFHAGLVLFSLYDVGIMIPGSQSILSIVKYTYGERLVAAVREVLCRTDLDLVGQRGMRIGALRLAGYIGSGEFAKSIRQCWDQDESTVRDLRSYLFAAARCCGNEAEVTLGPICDAWENLPDESDHSIGKPVNRLATHGVDWAFRDYIPQDSIGYFVAKANSSKKLKWAITYMLRTIDHPAAVEHIARYSARLSYVATHLFKDEWESHSRRRNRQMSEQSKNHLLKIILNESESTAVRKQAFSFWELVLPIADLSFLRQIPEGSPLFDQALWARARRGDYSVIPQVLLKVRTDPEHWLRIGYYVWSDALTDMLESIVDSFANEQIDTCSNLEYVVADALMQVEPKRRISMLKEKWDKLRSKPLMVQTTLLSAGADAAALTREAFEVAPEPNALLEHFVSSVTLIGNVKRKLSMLGQMHNLVPYLKFFSDEDIFLLWDRCTKGGWLDFRSQYLEPRIRKMPSRSVCLPEDSVDTFDLDEALNASEQKAAHLHFWFERRLRDGFAREKIFAALLQWFTENRVDRALCICGEIVSHDCTRSEFMQFEAVASERLNSSELIEAVRFDVFNRSLI